MDEEIIFDDITNNVILNSLRLETEGNKTFIVLDCKGLENAANASSITINFGNATRYKDPSPTDEYDLRYSLEASNHGQV